MGIGISSSKARKGKETGQSQQKNQGDTATRNNIQNKNVNNNSNTTSETQQSENNPIIENPEKSVQEVHTKEVVTIEKTADDPNAPSSDMFEIAKEFLVTQANEGDKEVLRSNQEEYPIVNSNPIIQATQDLTTGNQ